MNCNFLELSKMLLYASTVFGFGEGFGKDFWEDFWKLIESGPRMLPKSVLRSVLKILPNSEHFSELD